MPEANEAKPVKIDRRIVRTRQALRAALMELVQEKEYLQISVEEVASRANVSRATFYLHYKDKDDLLLDQVYEMAMERVQVLSGLPAPFWLATLGVSGAETQPVLPLVGIFELAEKNASLYRILLSGGSARRLVDGIRAITARAFTNFLNTKFQNELQTLPPSVPVDLLAAYFSGALLSTMGWWLEQEPRLPPEEITLQFSRLFFPGVKKAFGLDTLSL